MHFYRVFLSALAAAGLSLPALAAFDATMSAGALADEARREAAQGSSTAAMTRAALAAKVEPGALTTAVLTGAREPLATLQAVLGASPAAAIPAEVKAAIAAYPAQAGAFVQAGLDAAPEQAAAILTAALTVPGVDPTTLPAAAAGRPRETELGDPGFQRPTASGGGRKAASPS